MRTPIGACGNCDVKKETYYEKYIDDENERNLDKARHLKIVTVDYVEDEHDFRIEE